jgi:4-amino-4-deoxy-L-arabinose transferase-like glycosyltransferase
LYYLSAALSAKVLGSVLPLHDGARVVTGIWMLLTLVVIGMTGRELWGKGFGRQTTFIFISSIGLIISAHTMTPDVASLTAVAACFYALALARRRPYRASVLLGLGMCVGFLSTGLLPISMVLLTCVLLPFFFHHWRTIRFAKVVSIGILIAAPLIVAWILLCLNAAPLLFDSWWSSSLAAANQSSHLYFLNILLWYAWPSLPLAVWGLWRYRARLLNQAKFQLCIIFFISAYFTIGFLGESRDLYAMPLLIPLTALASGSIETLKRGAAGALNWFGLILFGFMGFLIWLGWGAMMSGSPAKLKERLVLLSGLPQLDFNVFAFSAASAITIIWIFAALRSQHSNRAAATNWAIGITFVWTLLMSLWLPMIDSARSYRDVFTSLKSKLPPEYTCVAGEGIGDSQRELLHYYVNIKPYFSFTEDGKNCDLYLIQDDKYPKSVSLGNDWQQIWSGKRASDGKESFRLFQQMH